MKIKKLICHKCGNTKEFRVDVQFTYVSTCLTFNEDNEAELDTDFPNDVDIMFPVCAVCDTELHMEYPVLMNHITEPHVLCPSCLHYVNADVVETCPRKKKEYPNCFMWAREEAELQSCL